MFFLTAPLTTEGEVERIVFASRSPQEMAWRIERICCQTVCRGAPGGDAIAFYGINLDADAINRLEDRPHFEVSICGGLWREHLAYPSAISARGQTLLDTLEELVPVPDLDDNYSRWTTWLSLAQSFGLLTRSEVADLRGEIAPNM